MQNLETTGLLSDSSTTSLSVRLRDTPVRSPSLHKNPDDVLSIVRELQEDVQFIKQRMQVRACTLAAHTIRSHAHTNTSVLTLIIFQSAEGTQVLSPRKRNPILKPWYLVIHEQTQPHTRTHTEIYINKNFNWTISKFKIYKYPNAHTYALTYYLFTHTHTIGWPIIYSWSHFCGKLETWFCWHSSHTTVVCFFVLLPAWSVPFCLSL